MFTFYRYILLYTNNKTYKMLRNLNTRYFFNIDSYDVCGDYFFKLI